MEGLILLALCLGVVYGRGYPIISQKPDKNCHQLGQYLYHPDVCRFKVCVYGEEPWTNENDVIPLFSLEMMCPPGVSVNKSSFSAAHNTNPCTIFNKKCQGDGQVSVKSKTHKESHKSSFSSVKSSSSYYQSPKPDGKGGNSGKYKPFSNLNVFPDFPGFPSNFPDFASVIQPSYGKSKPNFQPRTYPGPSPNKERSYQRPPTQKKDKHSGPPPQKKNSYPGPPPQRKDPYPGPPPQRKDSYPGPPPQRKDPYPGPPPQGKDPFFGSFPWTGVLYPAPKTNQREHFPQKSNQYSGPDSHVNIKPYIPPSNPRPSSNRYQGNHQNSKSKPNLNFYPNPQEEYLKSESHEIKSSHSFRNSNNFNYEYNPDAKNARPKQESSSFVFEKHEHSEKHTPFHKSRDQGEKYAPFSQPYDDGANVKSDLEGDFYDFKPTDFNFNNNFKFDHDKSIEKDTKELSKKIENLFKELEDTKRVQFPDFPEF